MKRVDRQTLIVVGAVTAFFLACGAVAIYVNWRISNGK